MFRDTWLNRLALHCVVLFLDSIAPWSFVYLAVSFATYPAPALVALTAHLPVEASVDLLLRLDKPLRLLVLGAAAEAGWAIFSLFTRAALDRRWWDYNGGEASLDEVSSEERWRLWKAMLESSKDPWDWLGGFFLPPGHKRAPRGAKDPLLSKVKPEQIGRTNVEEFIAHFMFNSRLRDLKKQAKKSNNKRGGSSLALAELHSMVLLLEAQFTLSRIPSPSSESTTTPSSSAQPFRFLRGRSPHRVFQLSQEPLSMRHHPLLFYLIIRVATAVTNVALYCSGFRYYGASSWTSFRPFPFFRSARRSLESVLDPIEAEKMGDARLADRVGYWMKPANQKRAEEDARPIVFCHGISGLFTTAPFMIALSYLSGRAMFVPELPYLSMRLSPPSAILTRLEYVAAVRRMLWAHGFGLTSLDPLEGDEEEGDYKVEGRREEYNEEWRRAKCVVVAHSFGAVGGAAWLLRDAADLVAGIVLIDPMSLLLFSADAPRNFFRTKCKTAGEIFFRYFALERGISHFLSRHLRWHDSAIFSPRPVAPLPQRVVDALVPACARDDLDPEDPEDIPFYAPTINPCGEGPLPSVVFFAEKDCILPVSKLEHYLSASAFSTSSSSPPPPYSEKNGSAAVIPSPSPSTPPSTTASLRVMKGLEHGAILASWSWCREVAKAVEHVADAARRWDEEDE
ncbi:hypothetical protein JCM8547_008511 [Rhodosporidiobolus lusitaniae]